MDKRTTGIIATAVAVVLCGCPGLLSLCWGVFAAFASFAPGANIPSDNSIDPRSALVTGVAALCAGVLLIAIPVLVGYFTLRRRNIDVVNVNEPVPPPL
jgi:ABC-type branched-subunit amino acid transport system permease subunit